MEEDTNFEESKYGIDLMLKSFKTKIRMIIDRLNIVLNNFETYFNIIDRIFSNYNNYSINYNICDNIFYVINSLNGKILNNKIFNDFISLLKDNSYKEFIPRILNIYNEMNKNEIDLVYNIQNNQDRVKIFGNQFVKNNKNLCNIIFEKILNMN